MANSRGRDIDDTCHGPPSLPLLGGANCFLQGKVLTLRLSKEWTEDADGHGRGVTARRRRRRYIAATCL